MYKITVAKDNLNILINDLGKKITSSKPLIISDDLYEKSLYIKKVAKLIKVEKVDDSIYINEQQKDIESKDSIEEAKDKVFIKTVSEDYIPEENKEELENKVFIANENLNDDIISNNNAFIKNVDNESDTEIKVEDIKEETTSSKEELFNNNNEESLSKKPRKKRKTKDTSDLSTNEVSLSNSTFNPIMDQLAKDVIDDLRKSKYKISRFDNDTMEIVFNYMYNKF